MKALKKISKKLLIASLGLIIAFNAIGIYNQRAKQTFGTEIESSHQSEEQVTPKTPAQDLTLQIDANKFAEGVVYSEIPTSNGGDKEANKNKTEEIELEIVNGSGQNSSDYDIIAKETVLNEVRSVEHASDEEIFQFAIYCLAYDLHLAGYIIHDGFVQVGEECVSGLIFSDYEKEYNTEDGVSVYSAGFIQTALSGSGEYHLSLADVENGIIAAAYGQDEYAFLIEEAPIISAYSAIFKDRYFKYVQVSDFVAEFTLLDNQVANYDEKIDLFDFNENRYIFKASVAYESNFNPVGLFSDEAVAYQQAKELIENCIKVQEKQSFQSELASIVIYTEEIIDEYLLNQQVGIIQVGENAYSIDEIQKQIDGGEILIITPEGIFKYQLANTDEMAEARTLKGVITIIGGLIATGVGIFAAIVSCGATTPTVVTSIGVVAAGCSMIYGVSEIIEGAHDIYYGVTKDVFAESPNYVKNAFKDMFGDETGEQAYHIFGITSTMVAGCVISVGSTFSQIGLTSAAAISRPVNVVALRALGVSMVKEIISMGASMLVGETVSNITYELFDNHLVASIIGGIAAISTGILIERGAYYLDRKYDFSGYRSLKNQYLVLMHYSPLEDGVLTDSEINQQRAKAGRDLKKEALQEIIDGTDLNGLDPTNENDAKIIEFVIENGRFPSYANGDPIQCEFAHAIDVNEIKKAYQKGLITKEEALDYISDPNNGLLVSHETHLYILHNGSWKNITDYKIAMSLRPDISDRIQFILKQLAE